MDLCETSGNDNRHPWEISRTENILSLCGNLDGKSVADIGAGDQYFLYNLAANNKINAYAIDVGYEKKYEKKAGIIALNNIKELPEHSIDVFIMMDVLEHIENEDAFLEELLSKMTDEGKLIITVPAFNWLYSNHDEFLKHYRRYNHDDMSNVLLRNGLIIKKSFYFYTTLFYYRCFQKLLEKFIKKEEKGIGNWKLKKEHFVTKLIKCILNIDFRGCCLLNEIGIKIPGLSLFMECEFHRNKK